MKERLDYIDRAKGILIILMVIGHIWQSGFVFDLIYAFHMPAFFVISGILMHYTKSYQKPMKQFLIRKILAYGIPFLWIEVLGVLTDILRHGVTLNIKGYLYNTFTLNCNDPNLWFLVTLFLIEILFVAVLLRIKQPVVICAVAAVLFCIRYVLPTHFNYVSDISRVFKYLPFFLAGFYGHMFWKKVSNPAAACCGFAVLISVLLGSVSDSSGVFFQDLRYLLVGCCGSYVILSISQGKLNGFANSFFVFTGRNTIVVFGTHHIFYAALGELFGIKDFATTPIAVGILILTGVIVLEIPTIYIINRWFPFLVGKFPRKSGVVT